MRHSVHLMFGSNFETSLRELKTYVIKYGEEAISPYFTALLLEKGTGGSLVISSVEIRAEQPDAPFVSGLQNLYTVEKSGVEEFPADQQQVHVAHYFDTLYRNTITINNPGDSRSLHLCLYLPLYDAGAWAQVRELIDIIMGLSISYQIDIIGLAADTAFVFTPEEEKKDLALLRENHLITAARVLGEVVEYQKANSGFISNFILFQNCQEDGLSLKLDQDTFTRITGEFALLAIEHYATIFIPVPTEEAPLKALGLSVLNFDKYYFVQYLLRRTYLHIMEREQVAETKVDIARVMLITEEKLRGKTNIVSDFYEQEVRPLLAQKINQDKIIADITPKLNKLIDNIGDDLQSFIVSPDLSLPEKKAILATMLGMDDPLITGYAFSQTQLIIDDLDMEGAGIYIDANNELRNRSKYGDHAVLSDSQDAYLPLKEIKRIREDLRQSSTFIREKEEQLKEIDAQREDAQKAGKRLIENGFFVYEGQRYRLQTDVVQEKPLAETYQPVKISVDSVDLRPGFTPVKNQGNQGSCSAFSMASVYEYILKSNQNTETDLSEAFLYYNARKVSGSQDKETGVSFYDSITALTTEGICTEELFPYNDSACNIEPSKEAYVDGASRLVKKAMNVCVHIDDIRSALSQGYPVVVSVNIFESFSTDTTGFIFRPSEEEIKSGKSGSHAMVICGFSDEKRVFILRNSWGNSFGENGYCYLPYSYIGDSKLVNMACIITEVDSGFVAGGKEKKMQLYFDTTDANLNYAITRNLIQEEEYRVAKLTKKDNKYRQQYYTLMGKLGNNNLRKRIVTGMEYHLEDQAQALTEQQNVARTDRERELRVFKRTTWKIGSYLVSAVVFLWLALIITFYYLSAKDMFSSGTTWYWLLLSLALVGLMFLYFPYRRNKYRLLDEEWKDRIASLGVAADRKRRDGEVVRLRMHLAGMVLDRLFSLQSRLKNKYNVMRSFTGNLSTWYHREKQEIEEMDSSTKDPFLSLLSNEVLDRYYEKNREVIGTDIRLYNFLTGYEITEEGIQKFNKEIKDTVVKEIFSLIADFKIYSHVSQEREYPYLDKEYADIDKLLPVLDAKSKVFVQLKVESLMNNPHKVIFIRTDEQREKNRWNSTYPRLFITPPVSCNLVSPYKIMVVRVQNLDLSQVRIAR